MGKPMNKNMFVKTALAGAVATTVCGTAIAADIGSPATFPKLQGSVFLGADNTKIRLTATASADEALMQAHIHYYTAAGVFVSSSLPTADTASGANDVIITMTVSTPATATQAIITLDQNGAADTAADGQPFAYVATDGTLVGAADEATAIADAITAGAFHPVDPTYNTISVTDAKVDVVATPKVAYVTFNADPNIARGDALAAGSKVDVKEGLASTAIVSATDASIAGSLTSNVHAFLDDDTNAGNEAIGAVTAFGAAIASVSNAAGLDDGAGNVPTSAATIDPVVALAPPAYASGIVMVQDNADADDLYDGGVAAIRVNIRLNDAPDAASWDEAEDVAFNTGATAGGFAVTADADGNNTILQVTATGAGGDLFFADPSTGNITYGADRESAVPFTAQVKQATTNGGASDLALGLNNAVVITGDLAATQVVVGQVQAPVAATVDSDLDGVIDGVSIDFRQALSGLVAGNNLGLVSYQDDSDLQGDEVARPVNLATETPTIDATSTTVSMTLTNKDVFDADGNPPATTVNDYNGDGTADSDDADLVVPANMDTAADDVQPNAGGIPFKAEIGINTAAAEEDNSEVKTSLTYAKAYDVQTGANLAVATGEFDDVEDGASPVVKRVEYVEDDDGSSGRDPSGTVTIVASEDLASLAPNVGEFLFDGKPVSLINLDANMEDKVRAEDPTDAGDDTDFDLTAVPGTVFGQVLSLGVEPNVEDANGNALVLSANATQNTVAEPAAAAPRIVSAKPLHGASPLKWNKVEVTYDQEIEAPTGAELDGVFVVRARVGAKRGPSFEDRDDDDDFYDFRIPADNVEIDGKVVTLTLPIDDFPADTTQIFVDYEGATQAEIDNDAALNFIQATSNQVPADVGGDDLFFGEIDDFKIGCNDREIVETDDPDDVDVCAGIEDDADTVEADVPALFLATHARDNQRKLFTQTVQGTIKQTNPTTDEFGPVIDDAGIRIDLIRVTEYSTSAVVAKKAVVSNGAIEVRRGPNSGNFNNHAEVGDSSDDNGNNASDNHDDNSDADQWQNIALLNKAVTVQLITNYNNQKGKISAEQKKLNAAIAEGQSSSQIAKIEENIQKLENDLETNFGNGTILAYVEVTTGNGKDGVDASNVNPNANVGRTATLLANLPNTVKNGTTTYPVWVDLDDGEVWAADYGEDEDEEGVNGIQHGFIVINPPVAAQPSQTMKKYELLDTAYTHVENGQYKGVVGMVEDSVDSKSKSLTPKYDDAFILVSYRDTNTGDWILTNQAESSFESAIPFAADLMGDGTPTKHNINVDNIWMSHMPEQEDAIWQLLGMPGVMARDDAKPLDMGRFFITIDTATGNPITVWENDGAANLSEHEMAFTMGLGDKPNQMQLVFELGGNNSSAALKQYGSLNPAAGAAIAYNGDDYAADDGANTGDADNGKPVDGDHLLDDQTKPDYLFVPMTGTGAVADLKEGWHLISLAEAESIATLAGNNANIDAVIAFVSTADADNTVRNYTWFDGDDINADELNAILPKGTGMFIHVNTETSGFTFK